MRVGIMIDRLNVGGVEKIAIEQVRSLRKENVDASLVVLRKKSVVSNPFGDIIDEIPIIYLDERLPAFLKMSFKFPIFNFFSSFHLTYPLLLPTVVKKREFDYFIVHGTYTSITAVTLKKFRGISFSAFIWDPISYILERVYKQTTNKILYSILIKTAYLFDKFLIKNMDYVLVGGPAHNKYIHTINPNKSIKTIYPSVEPIRKQVLKDDYVLVATAWKKGKSPEYLIDIAKAIPDIHIKMIGKWIDSEYYNEFKLLVEKMRMQQRIEIVGEVSEKDLGIYFAKALVVLQTNDDRGFGMPALEAAGRATTFIVPEGQGVCDLFVDGVDGFYTKEKDTKRITELINKLRENPKMASKMGKSAWNKVVKNYSWKNHAQKLIDLIKEANKID